MAVQNVYNYSKPRNVQNVMSKPQEKPRVMVTKRTGEYGNQYLEQKVMASKPEELTMMLYEGIIKFINQAKIFMGQKNIERTNNAILRAQAIVSELSGTLDMEFIHSGELLELYDFITKNLIDANLTKEVKPLDDALEIATEMRQMWKEVMEAVK